MDSHAYRGMFDALFKEARHGDYVRRELLGYRLIVEEGLPTHEEGCDGGNHVTNGTEVFASQGIPTEVKSMTP